MLGPEGGKMEAAEDLGIIPRALAEIAATIEATLKGCLSVVSMSWNRNNTTA